jgi:hypothetical protein
MRLKFEPTIVLQTLSAMLALVVTFGLPWLTAEQAGLIVAAVAAVIGVWNAVKVRPIAPAAFQAAVTAGAALLTTYGFHLTQERIGAVQVLIVALVALLTRVQVSPTATVTR